LLHARVNAGFDRGQQMADEHLRDRKPCLPLADALKRV
jgi:hypothetical protein